MSGPEANLSANVTIGLQTIQDPRHFFISYERDSARDLATHLHDSLHKRGVIAFLDVRDLEEGLSAAEYQQQIDEAVIDAKVFLLIVTNGAYNSAAIRHELELALGYNDKKVLAFIDETIWNLRGELTFTINGRNLFIKDFDVRSFNHRTPELLLREVCDSANVTRIIKAE
jgi:hypothetical protein